MKRTRRRSRPGHDFAGQGGGRSGRHYSRPDVTRLMLNKTPGDRVAFSLRRGDRRRAARTVAGARRDRRSRRAARARRLRDSPWNPRSPPTCARRAPGTAAPDDYAPPYPPLARHKPSLKRTVTYSLRFAANRPAPWRRHGATGRCTFDKAARAWDRALDDQAGSPM